MLSRADRCLADSFLAMSSMIKSNERVIFHSKGERGKVEMTTFWSMKAGTTADAEPEANQGAFEEKNSGSTKGLTAMIELTRLGLNWA